MNLAATERSIAESDIVARRYAKAIRNATRVAIEQETRNVLIRPEPIIEELLDAAAFNFLKQVRRLENLRPRAIRMSIESQGRSLAARLGLSWQGIRERFRQTVTDFVMRSIGSVQRRATAAVLEGRQLGKRGRSLVRYAFAAFRVMNLAGESELVVSEVGQVAASAASFAQGQADPDVWGYEYVHISHTLPGAQSREHHLAIHQMVLRKDNPAWPRVWPPSGFSCRCQAVPIYQPQPEVIKPIDFAKFAEDRAQVAGYIPGLAAA